jgi:Xaa-Pro aminopeptidase
MTSPAGGVADRITARRARLERTREAMRTAGIDALLLSIGADLPWLSGYEAMPLERPTVLLVPLDDDPTLVVPVLEAPRVDTTGELFGLRPWGETEDAVGIVADLIGRRSHLAFSDRAFAGLLVDLLAALPHATISKASVVMGPLRAVKDNTEVAALRAAGAAADEVSAALFAGEIALIGRSEHAVSTEIGDRLRQAGHRQVNFAIVASGPNAASPHHEPGARVIAPGETVVCDFGGALSLDGDIAYCSDTTRTVVTGIPDAEIRELYSVLEAAQEAARQAVEPGVSCEAIDATARSMIAAAGFGEYFIHRTGHGIGIEEHEDPYLVEGNAAPVVAGNAFSIEPGIYVPGRYGARIEDIVIATDGGSIACNVADHSLRVVEV